MELVREAFALSKSMLAAPMPNRWQHVQAVAAQARGLEKIAGVEGDDLQAAAVLHDIGYAPAIARLGFHPLDGARLLEERGWPVRVIALVARHSCASVEAELRGIDGLDDYIDDESATRDALWYCDATTGPQGQRLSPDERWTEIRARYGPHSLVAQFLDLAEPELRRAVDRTLTRMRLAGLDP